VDKLLDSLAVGLELVALGRVGDSLANSLQQISEADFKPTIQVGRLRLVNIQINAQDVAPLGWGLLL
jgi:hypothetical protein